MRENLEVSQSESFIYFSPTSKNEMGEVIDKNIILRDIFKKIWKNQASTAFAADEVTSSIDKNLHLCFRYVDENMETFAIFLDLERLAGEDIARKFLDFYMEIKNKS